MKDIARFSLTTTQEFTSEKVARHGKAALHPTGKGKSYSNHSGKGKSYRSAYVSYPEVDERSSSTWETTEETFETNFDEGDACAWLGDGFDEEEAVQEQELDYLEDEEEAIALNAMLDLDEADDRQAGEAIQLQLAAFNAFSKAKF